MRDRRRLDLPGRGPLSATEDLISARLAEVIADFSGREVHIFDRHQDFFDEKESIARDFSELTRDILASEENQCRANPGALLQEAASCARRMRSAGASRLWCLVAAASFG